MMSASRIAFIIGFLVVMLSHAYMLQQGGLPADQMQNHALVNMAAGLMMLPDSGFGKQLMRFIE